MSSVITSDHLEDNAKVFDNYFLCIHICICVYRYMEAYTLMCVSTCEGQMSTLFLRHCPPYFLRQKLSLARNLPSRIDCLATKLQFSSNFYFPTVEYASVCHLTQFFHMGSEHQTQLLMFAQPKHCQLYYLFSPKLIYFFDQNAQNLVGKLQFPKGSVLNN